jgi:hypothetical protein
MFTDISFVFSELASNPKQLIESIDSDEILNLLNEGRFVDRIFPHGDLASEIESVISEVGSNCHDVTSEVKKYKPELEIAYGYLAVSNTPLHLSSPYLVVDSFSNWLIEGELKRGNEVLASRKLKETSEMWIDEQHHRVVTKLRHHSVLLDAQGNYIECIHDRYPVANEDGEVGYVFFPHKSGQRELVFEAYSPLPSADCSNA